MIIARSGIPGATRLIADYKENTIYCGFIICFSVSKIDLKNILFYQLKNVEKAMSNQSGGTIMKNVNQGTLRDIKLALPNKRTIPYNSKF
ncbi:MAG: restriction endonuclease subunit S [Saprospirales bacterium]|nr:restriction endonuclease subunit S [Saprospirales bacterium]